MLSVIKGKQIEGKSHDSTYVTLEQYSENYFAFRKVGLHNVKKTEIQSTIKDVGLYFVNLQQLLKYILIYVLKI